MKVRPIALSILLIALLCDRTFALIGDQNTPTSSSAVQGGSRASVNYEAAFKIAQMKLTTTIALKQTKGEWTPITPNGLPASKVMLQEMVTHGTKQLMKNLSRN